MNGYVSNSPVEFALRWIGGSVLNVEPQQLRFGGVPAGEIVTQRLQVSLESDSTGVDWNPQNLDSVEGLPRDQVFPTWERIDDGIQVTVEVRPNPEQLTGRGMVIIKPGSGIKDLRVPIDWEIEQPVTITPKAAFAGLLSPNEAWAVKFALSIPDGRIIRISKSQEQPDNVDLTEALLADQIATCNITGAAPNEPGSFAISVPISIETGSGVLTRSLTIAGRVDAQQ